MHTCGLVLTLCNEPALAQAALTQLASAGPFEISPSLGSFRALVLETPDPKSSHHWHDWAVSLPGVEAVEVVFVHWEEESQVPHANS